MTEGKRPGGLTALAVLNFVFGGFNGLGVLGLMTVLALVAGAQAATGNSGNEGAQEISEALKDTPMGVVYFALVLAALNTLLLIASGVGYLQQKKFLGRTLGNCYGGLQVVATLVSGSMLEPEAGGGFGIGAIIGLIYPLLTLILLNSTFKEDFIR